MSVPVKMPRLARLLPQSEDRMRYFAKDTPEVRLKALRWCLLPRILAASGWVGGMVIAAIKFWPRRIIVKQMGGVTTATSTTTT